MTSLNILDALVEYLEESLKNLLLPTKDENVLKAPTVHDGYLPPKQNRKRGEDDPEQEDYPFVVVRYLGEEDEIFNQNNMQFRILVGTYSKDEQRGWRDTMNVMNRIKFHLKEQQVIGSANLTGKIESALFEEQMKPTWHGVMEVEFEVPQVKRNRRDLDDSFFGE